MKNENCIYKGQKTKQCCLIEFIKSLLNVKECKDVTGFNPKEKGMNGFFAFFQVELRFYPCHRKPNTYTHKMRHRSSVILNNT